MESLARKAVVAALVGELRNRGSWCGEMHVQKSTYFLQELLDVDLGYQFVFYKHGPYSFELSDVITSMIGDGFLELRPQAYPYGPSIDVSEFGSRLQPYFPPPVQEPIGLIGEVLGEKTARQLERLATALYVTVRAEGQDKVSRASRVLELKPHIPQEKALAAVEEVDQIIERAAELTS